MDVWGTYKDRSDARGKAKRDAHRFREIRNIEQRLPDSLSYTTATIYEPEHGWNIASLEVAAFATEMEVAIINSDNLNEKMILAMPGDEIPNGSLVHWMDQYWLITEQDANNTIYRRSKMVQCNHLLRWVSKDHEICEQWCIVEDGTKYLTGEYEDRNFVVTRGDSRISVQLARNKETVLLDRSNRFLIDDIDSPHPLAYLLTKPLKLGSYQEKGCFKFVLQEVTETDDDNIELRIADYYKHFPRGTEFGESPAEEKPDEKPDVNGKKVWL